MTDPNFPFLRPYEMVYNDQGQLREVISYPYPEGDKTLVKVREKDDPTTIETAAADKLYPSNWNQYALAHKQCFVQAVKAATEPVRLESGVYFEGWSVFPPSPYRGSVYCADTDEARKVAQAFDCTIIL